MIDRSSDPLATAGTWLAEKRKIALATVTRTWGSAPRPAGSQMVVREDGAFNGSVSGGCVEGAVISEALAAIEDGRPRNLKFGVSNEDAWAVGLACGGTVEVHVAPVSSTAQQANLSLLQQTRRANNAIVLASELTSGETRLIPLDQAGSDALVDAARLQSRRDESASVVVDGRTWFLSVFNPPLDLAIIGAVHIAQPLARMALQADCAVRIIDPRTSFATAERFPGIALAQQWPDEALRNSPLSARSALVALTHDPKLDDPALAAGLRSPAFYIGALGSKTTHASRLNRLKLLGFSSSDLDRIKAPIGLDIGARSPAEIAVAVLGQIIAELRHLQKK